MPAVQETIERVRHIEVDQYKYGFVTDIESDKAPKGLSEDTVRFISAKKNEPAWMLEWRLDAYRRWLTMREPQWARVDYGPIDYQDLYYYSAPKRNALASLDEVDPEILKTYAKLGIPLREQEMLAGVEREDGTRSRVAVDAVFDSVSVATTFQEELAKAGVLFMPISEALQKHPELVKKYLGTVVPISDNFFATARAKICDRDAVVRALKSGQLAGYAGDVWYPQPAPKDHPWRTMPHHGMTPHTSGSTLSAQARYAAGTREILECWFEGRPIREEYLIVDRGKLAGAGAHSYSVGKTAESSTEATKGAAR